MLSKETKNLAKANNKKEKQRKNEAKKVFMTIDTVALHHLIAAALSSNQS